MSTYRIQQERTTSQVITRRQDARELLPEEKLSPPDRDIYERVIEKAKRTRD